MRDIPGNDIPGYVRDMDGNQIMDEVSHNSLAYCYLCKAIDYLKSGTADRLEMALIALQGCHNELENSIRREVEDDAREWARAYSVSMEQHGYGT